MTKAFVMNSFQWKDRHRLLHLLTPEHGLITAMAPAAESLKSKLRAVSQLFSYSELTLSEQNGRYTVKDGAVIEAFTALSQDLDRLAAAAHAVEVFSDVARNDEPNRQVFELWAYTVYEISRSEDPVFIARMSSMRLMEIIGLSPDLDACISCREPIEGAYFFSYLAGGLLCEKDRAKGQRDAMTVLSKGTVALLLHIERAPFEKLYRFWQAIRYAGKRVASRTAGWRKKWKSAISACHCWIAALIFLLIQRKAKRRVNRKEASYANLSKSI